MADLNNHKKKPGNFKDLACMDTSILDFIAEGVCIVDDKHKIEFVNNSALNMLEYEKGEVIGKNIHRLLHSERGLKDCRSHRQSHATPSAGICARRGQTW